MQTRVQSEDWVYNKAMKPVKERAEDALAKIIPILKEHFVDMGAETFIDNEGHVKARVVWLDTEPKPEPEAAVESPKETENA